MLYTLYKEAQNICGNSQQIVRQREIERPKRTYAYIYMNRVMKTVVHDSNKAVCLEMRQNKLHFVQHKEV